MFNQRVWAIAQTLYYYFLAYAVFFTCISSPYCQYIYDIGLVWSPKIKSNGDFEQLAPYRSYSI